MCVCVCVYKKLFTVNQLNCRHVLRCLSSLHFKLCGLFNTLAIPVEEQWWYCCILTFDPAQKCHSKVMHRKEVTHSNGSYERKSRGRKLADEKGRPKKFPWYTHRLMHRKRVTCELHECYFRLMTIKYSISKIEWAIVWVLNYYITQSRRKSSDSWVEFQFSCSRVGVGVRRDVVGKATPGRRAPREPRWSLGTREVADKML